MNELYQGTLDKDNVETAIEELKKIQLELQAFSPDKVVWDIDDLSNQPPWGKNISNDITNLSNYFVTRNPPFISMQKLLYSSLLKTYYIGALLSTVYMS